MFKQLPGILFLLTFLLSWLFLQYLVRRSYVKKGDTPPAIFGGYKIRPEKATAEQKREFFLSIVVTLTSFVIGLLAVVAYAAATALIQK